MEADYFGRGRKRKPVCPRCQGEKFVHQFYRPEGQKCVKCGMVIALREFEEMFPVKTWQDDFIEAMANGEREKARAAKEDE